MDSRVAPPSKRVHGLAHGLAAEIPERHFDGTQGVDDHAAPAVHRGAE